MILWNDRFVSREECRIDIEDRGYQFGDGIYEVISFYGKKLFKLEQHLERLKYCADQISMPLPYSLPKIADNLTNLVEQNEADHGQVYMQITRGYAPRNHSLPDQSQPVLTAYTMNYPRPLEAQKKGVSVVTTEDIRWLRCDIKSLNLLGSMLAKKKATEYGAAETILHREGTVTEGSSSNVFIVQDGTVYTHPANHFILKGITRTIVIQIANNLNIPVIEKPFTLEKLLQADEVFITSTIQEIMPVVQVDDKTIGDGKPGFITTRLKEQFQQLINQ